MISFSKRLITVFALLSLSGFVSAQGPKIEEDFDYRILPIAQPVEIKGKVEVIEFFWYGCPHCYDFEPELSSWVKRQPKDVVFKEFPWLFVMTSCRVANCFTPLKQWVKVMPSMKK